MNSVKIGPKVRALTQRDENGIVARCERLMVAARGLTSLARVVRDQFRPVLKPINEPVAQNPPPDPCASVLASLEYIHKEVEEASRILFTMQDGCQL